jgi:hypothetical protein
MLIASSRKHIMWYKEEIEKLLPDVARDKVATYPGLMNGALPTLNRILIMIVL